MKEIYWVVILFPTCVLGIVILFRLVYCGPWGFILPLFILKNFTKQNKKSFVYILVNLLVLSSLL